MTERDTGRIATRAAVMIAEAEADGRRVVGWRVSADIRDELARRVPVVFSGDVEDLPEWSTGGSDRLLGAPLVVDPTLPPNSIMADLR